METGIALCRHPLTQFGYDGIADRVDMHLLCHPAKSQLRSAAPRVPAARIHEYPGYDTNALVEDDAARIAAGSAVRAVVALSEVDVLRAARLRDRHGIPGMGEATARLFRDKIEMKRRLAAAGVRVPRSRPVEDGLDVREAQEEYGFPFVVKPRLGGGSVGARVLRDDGDVRALLGEGLLPNFYTPAHLEAEEFVDGPLHHVDGLVLDGRIHLRSVSRYRSDLLAFTTPLSSRTVDLGSAAARRMTAFADRVLDELGLLAPGVSSYFHCEVFDAAGGPVLCEVAARPGGLGVVDQLDSTFGVDTFGLLLAHEFGLEEAGAQQPARADGFVGWIGVPVSWDVPRAWELVPEPGRVQRRSYDRTGRPATAISSVDLSGVLVVRSPSEDGIEALMDTVVTQLAGVS